MPGVKIGRYMKYEPEAIEVIRVIAEGYNSNQQQQQIKEQLQGKFALNIEQNSDQDITATTTAATQQQQHSNNELMNLEEWKKAQNKALAQANNEIFYLRELVQQQQSTINELTNKLLQIESKQRPWYKRIFK